MYTGEDIKNAQQERRENIAKGFVDNDFEKAKSGVYADTAENRRLGRVGQTFGTKKQGQKAHAEQVSASLTREQKEKEYKKKFEEYKKTPDFDKEKKELAKKIKEHYPSRGELSDKELGEYVEQ